MKKKYYFIRVADGNVISSKAVIARNPFLKMRGLLGKKEMGPEEAMLFFHASPIHTFGMKFPIDIVFITGSGEILRIDSSVGPNRTVFCRSYATIEFPENKMETSNVKKGDILQWFLEEESGQVFVEYALILGLLAIGVIVAFLPLMETVRDFLNSIVAYLVDV